MARYYRYRDRGWEASPRAIWAIIIVNVAVFLALFFLPPRTSNQALDFLAVARIGLLEHPWTLVTAMFTHAEPFHILGNMFMLYWFGDYLSRTVGEVKFLLLYFVGGIAGNLLFVLLEPFGAAIGASGAVFAIGGALAVMRPRAKVMMFPLPIQMDLWVYVLIGFVVIGILLPLGAGPRSGIGWQAHLGGLLVGLAAGWYFRRWERRKGIYY